MALASSGAGAQPEKPRQLRSPVASAKLAAASLDSVASLDRAMRVLQGSVDSPSAEPDSALSTLASYFLLRDSEARGFDPSAVGLSESEAIEASRVFASFDKNDDGVLSRTELQALMQSVLGDAAGEADVDAGTQKLC